MLAVARPHPPPVFTSLQPARLLLWFCSRWSVATPGSFRVPFPWNKANRGAIFEIINDPLSTRERTNNPQGGTVAFNGTSFIIPREDPRSFWVDATAAVPVENTVVSRQIFLSCLSRYISSVPPSLGARFTEECLRELGVSLCNEREKKHSRFVGIPRTARKVEQKGILRQGGSRWKIG